MKISTANIADLAALHQLVEKAYRGDSARRGWTHEADLLGGQRTDKEALTEIFADPDQLMLAAWQEDALIGCVQLSRIDAQRCYLGMLTVDPDLQAQGLGRKLIEASEELVTHRWGASQLEMTVIRQRDDLIGYYERRGYVRTGEHRPFPLDDPRFGLPKTQELEFVVLRKALAST